MEYFKKFSDFELLDSGCGFRLERWGQVILQRPDPQIIWQPSLPQTEWLKAWAVYKSASEESRGQWQIKQTLPKPWQIKFNGVKFLLKLSPFKHTGLFAEQSAQWEWMTDRLKMEDGRSRDKKNFPPKADTPPAENPKSKILNLFAYTGGATMVLAKVGASVTHVDASKPAITWANENFKLNNLPKDSVRWILDDCVKFVKRELKRGAKYDGIIMDPPAFGHSPTGKTWKFNNDLPGLLNDCVKLLSDDAKFLVINGYATNSSAIALNNLLEDAMRSKKASASSRIEFGELCLKQKSDRLISTGIFARWTI